ncbi:hypothetical protein Tco_1525840 [Tanacetum coccineum]
MDIVRPDDEDKDEENWDLEVGTRRWCGAPSSCLPVVVSITSIAPRRAEETEPFETDDLRSHHHLTPYKSYTTRITIRRASTNVPAGADLSLPRLLAISSTSITLNFHGLQSPPHIPFPPNPRYHL